MARTFVRQETQIRNSDTYTDSTAPAATMESGAAHIEDDLNNLRSMVHHLLKLQTGNWYDAIATPSTFEGGAQRGVDNINQDLHDLERKRVLKCVWNLHSIAGGAGQHVVLSTGELPSNTTAAVGAVNTLGTVVAQAGTFNTAVLDEVAGSTAISPRNLVEIVNASTRDPILDAGDKIYGLLQTEDGVDGHTITDAATTRAQITFVKINGTGDDLILISAGAMNGINFDYCSIERVGLEDLNEQDFLGGANVDVPAGTTVTRQAGYDNQGVTPVDLTTNASLDLEGAGLFWEIRDDLEARLFAAVEGSAGGTSVVQVAAAVDTFDVDAVVNDFLNGASFDTAGTPIGVGVTSGEITRAADLTLRASGAGELFFDDSNQTGSTWAQDGIKLSETTAEWDNFETEFGEVSLLNAIVQAKNSATRTKGVAVVTGGNQSANTNITGVGGGANLDAQLPDYSSVTFLTDVDVYVNGILQRNGADASANHDVYPGDVPANGDLKFEYTLKGTGANPDVITSIVYGA